MERLRSILIRAAGFGAGTILALTAVCAVGYWWLQRPKAWTDNAIIAKFNELHVQEVGEQINFTFHYTLYNTTKYEYPLPAPGIGALMRQMPEKNGFDRITDSSWDEN